MRGVNKGKFGPMPDTEEYHIDGDEWIQAVAENYYVEPARDQGSVQFSINPKILHEDIGFYRTIDDVINALNDKKFQESMEIKRN